MDLHAKIPFVGAVNPDGTPLPGTIDRRCFPEREDPDAVRMNAMAEDTMRRKNQGNAASLNAAARRSDLNSARMRDDAVWGYEVNGERRYWL